MVAYSLLLLLLLPVLLGWYTSAIGVLDLHLSPNCSSYLYYWGGGFFPIAPTSAIGGGVLLLHLLLLLSVLLGWGAE